MGQLDSWDATSAASVSALLSPRLKAPVCIDPDLPGERQSLRLDPVEALPEGEECGAGGRTRSDDLHPAGELAAATAALPQLPLELSKLGLLSLTGAPVADDIEIDRLCLGDLDSQRK